MSKYEMHRRAERIKDYGNLMGVDPKKIENELRHEAELEQSKSKSQQLQVGKESKAQLQKKMAGSDVDALKGRSRGQPKVGPSHLR